MALAGGIAGYILGTLAATWLGPQFAGIAVRPIYMLLLVSIIISITISLLGIIPAYLAGIEPFSTCRRINFLYKSKIS
ncbi:MAG: hypothetical protein U5K51_09900 [Flavobacteriaceae bacterium]|nr:hypothetical protein [Flavobacteriaceae bacterium]